MSNLIELTVIALLAVALGYTQFRLYRARKREDDAWKLVELATDTMTKTNEQLRLLKSDPHFHDDGSVHILWERKDRLN